MSGRRKVLEFYRRSAADRLWRWRVKSTNGKILADSGEAYGRLRAAEHGARLVTGLSLIGIQPGDVYDFGEWRVVVEK